MGIKKTISDILKLPIGQVIWEDALGTTEWSDEDPTDDPTLMHTFGRIWKRKNSVVVYYSHSTNDECDSREYTKIPKKMVKEIILLKSKDAAKNGTV